MGADESALRNGDQGSTESNVDTSKLNPKVKQWLSEENNSYTSFSVSKSKDHKETSNNTLNVVNQESIPRSIKEPELAALDELRLQYPLFPFKRTKQFYNQFQIEDFEKRMIVISPWPMLLSYEDLMLHLNQTALKIDDKQATISKRIGETNLFTMKVLHNLALFGSEIEAFDKQIRNIHVVEHQLKLMNEKLKSAVKKTFTLLDSLPQNEQVFYPSPVEVGIPYLRKDVYTKLNLFLYTPWFNNLTPLQLQQNNEKEEYWLDVILPNWDEYIANNDNKFWRGGIPFRLRGHVWQRAIKNKLNITPEKYMEYQSVAYQNHSEYEREFQAELDVILSPSKSERKNESELSKSGPMTTTTTSTTTTTDSTTENKETTTTSSSNTTTTNSSESVDQNRTVQVVKVEKQYRRERNIRGLIQRDLPRTFPDLQLFKNPESDAYNQILKVLETSAALLSDIGYVQGMSYIAATLLLYMNHYETFVCFTNLISNPFLKSVCQLEHSTLARHSQLYQMIFSQYAPKLYEHFHSHNISTENFLLDWWLTLFTRGLQLPLACRVWDCILMEGEIIIHFVAVAMLKQFEKELLDCQFEQCLSFLSQLPQKVKEDELFEQIGKFEMTPKIKAMMEAFEKEELL
eukprot:TRINITY_DN688_c0_g2_i1.p1 TRINITY_DN688_c0_g2~~TRINITY_DN688_c0_g2_i1.p1  ORF type:complete len:631 (+),score=120.61 TRINITY_DN688_c0_g2_i1:50-1942(+)